MEHRGVVDDSSYPVRTSLAAPLEVARWRPFFAWLLAIPHLVILQVIPSVAGVLAIVSWFAILFTGRIPAGILDFQAMWLRYQWRVLAYVGGLAMPYPPFEFEMELDERAPTRRGSTSTRPSTSAAGSSG